MSKKRSRSSPIAEMMVQVLTLQHRAANPSNPGRRLSAQGALAKGYAAALFRSKLVKWAIPYLQRNPKQNASGLQIELVDKNAAEWKRFVQALSDKDKAAIGKAVSKKFPPANLRKHFSSIVTLAKINKTSRKRRV